MMLRKKYIYLRADKIRYRCELTLKFLTNRIRLQPQRQGFLFWENCGQWITVEESESEDIERGGNPLRDTYSMGNVSEIWSKGTLNIENRALELLRECVDQDRAKRRFISENLVDHRNSAQKIFDSVK